MSFFSDQDGWPAAFMEGDTVEFVGQSKEQRQFGGGNDDANSFLIVGKTYMVEKVEINKLITRLTLKNKQGRFNSVCFKLIKGT